MKRVALIGCGYWGKNYVKTFENIEEGRLKYVYDIGEPSIHIPENIIFTQNINDILNDPEVDGVIIAIPTRYIFDISKKFLEAGKHVLMEKPMTDSSEKALELIKLAQEKKLVLMIGHIYIHNPAIRKLKEIIDSGELGKILHMYAIRVSPGPIRTAEEINALWDLAPHDISIFLYLLGREPDKVKAFSGNFLKPGIIDSASFSLIFNNLIAEAHVRWLDAEKIRKLTVIGSKKIAVFDDLSKEQLKIYNKKVEFEDKAVIIDEGMYAPQVKNSTPLENQCKHFLECIEEKKEALTNGKNGYIVVKILEEIEKELGNFYEYASDNLRKDEKSNVKFLDLNRLHEPLKEKILKEIEGVINSNDYILGKKVEEFEKNFAEFLGLKFGIGVDSGTSAIELTLRALGIGNGDEVIIPANTFIATTSAVAFTGAKPILVDCDESYNIDINKIERAINANTKAIIPVHLYGQAADMDEINEIARRYNLKVIEDACQAHGATYKGKKIGNFSEAACFSFYPGKNLGGIGDGGMVVTDNEDLANKLKMLRNYGQSEKYHHDFLGYNRRLDSIQAAVLNTKLDKLNEWNLQRREIAKKYMNILKGTKVVLPIEKNDREHIYHLFVIRVPNRDKFKEFMKEKGIDTGIHYPIPTHLQKSYLYLGYKEKDFPLTEKYSKDVVSLPMFPGMTDYEINYVCDCIKEFCENN